MVSPRLRSHAHANFISPARLLKAAICHWIQQPWDRLQPNRARLAGARETARPQGASGDWGGISLHILMREGSKAGRQMTAGSSRDPFLDISDNTLLLRPQAPTAGPVLSQTPAAIRQADYLSLTPGDVPRSSGEGSQS